MKSLLVLLTTMLLMLPLCVEPVMADGKDELSLSGAYTRPNDGDATWAFTGEYLIAAGPFVLGPSFGLFDSPGVDGSTFGGAIELNTTGLSGLFGGIALHKVGGDAGDAIDYSGEARIGFKLGDGNGFFKGYLARTWTRDADGAVTSPDSTQAVMGLGLRF